MYSYLFAFAIFSSINIGLQAMQHPPRGSSFGGTPATEQHSTTTLGCLLINHQESGRAEANNLKPQDQPNLSSGCEEHHATDFGLLLAWYWNNNS